MLSMDDLFKGRQFDREIIILCVGWYLRFKLSFRDLVETHDQEAADAVEQVDRAALPRRPRRSSQQNAALLHGYGYALAFGREEAVEGGS